MAHIPGSVPITGFIAPTDDSDVYATIDPIYGIDGLRSVLDHATRDAITTQRRREGMLVYTQNDSSYWQLSSDLTTWISASFGGGGGSQGPQGFQGADGSVGATGGVGPQGQTGTGGTGPQGFQGNDGNDGPQGVQGSGGVGPQGTQGRQGFQGYIGPQGFQGGSGPQGPGVGTQGVQGFQGAAGAQGNQGIAGAGFQGAQGFQGDIGPQGPGVGAQGVQGPIGPQGPGVGTQGVQGFQGAGGGGVASGAQYQLQYNIDGTSFGGVQGTSVNLDGSIQFVQPSLAENPTIWLKGPDYNVASALFQVTPDNGNQTLTGGGPAVMIDGSGGVHITANARLVAPLQVVNHQTSGVGIDIDVVGSRCINAYNNNGFNGVGAWITSTGFLAGYPTLYTENFSTSEVFICNASGGGPIALFQVNGSNEVTIDSTGKLGAQAFQFYPGAQAGYILGSDASGNASWVPNIGPQGYQGPTGSTGPQGPGVGTQGPQGVPADFVINSQGDLIMGTQSSGPARLPIGDNGQILIADGSQSTGARWGSTGINIDSHYGTITTDTDGGTITFDLGVSDKHQVTLGGNRTLALSNDTVGQTFLLILNQDGTGTPRTVTWFSGIRWAGGTAPTLTTTASKSDLFTFLVVGSGSYFGFISGQNI